MRILLVFDVPGWSVHNVARQIAAQAAAQDGGRHEVRLLGRADWVGRPAALRAALEWSELHVFLWRFDLVAALEMLGPRAAAAMAERVSAVVVFDEVYRDPADLLSLGDPFAVADLVAVSSERLRALYRATPHLPDPGHVLVDGVDTGRFAPGDGGGGGPLQVAWVGDSAWGGNIAPDFKGFHGVFRPAMAPLEREGLAQARVADRQGPQVAPEAMPAFYRGVDVYACTSRAEGTPNPLLESMAAGAAVVTTDVGVAREVLGPEGLDFVLPREAAAFEAALRRLAGDRALLARLRGESLARRDALSWHARYNAWQALFAEAEAVRGDAERAGRKRRVIEALLARPRTPMARVRGAVFRSAALYRLYTGVLRRAPGVLRRLRGR
ncbi:glycosyltransferase family 4 protein [Jannaschia sp. W003]|uniref:glycosyltransferase family 4 protein n=1 Tax=Jannaschia sp. W003 TaxID=2867012 RepID=UPI0021A7E2E3|nr:glycosyltransferase family 4 protein [Jannaschia sp. W003]UWQ21518.1 glycosyltransferase family 4 protein [Jannaschia sp. W003]